MEVYMSASIATVIHLNAIAVCLVEGVGLLGSLESIPKRGETDGYSWLFRPRERPREVQVLPSPHFEEPMKVQQSGGGDGIPPPHR
jgi:hypothetical protein